MQHDPSLQLIASYYHQPSRDREHEFDRQVAAAVFRRYRAASGLGFTFAVPTQLRGPV